MVGRHVDPRRRDVHNSSGWNGGSQTFDTQKPLEDKTLAQEKKPELPVQKKETN